MFTYVFVCFELAPFCSVCQIPVIVIAPSLGACDSDSAESHFEHRCGKLYLFWINIAVQLIWAHFQWDRIILKIWPLYERSLTFSPFIPLSWQRNIVWISCNWLFYSLWREEEFEICFNLIGAFLSFIPILPLTLDFIVKRLFEKMPGMFVW